MAYWRIIVNRRIIMEAFRKYRDSIAEISIFLQVKIYYLNKMYPELGSISQDWIDACQAGAGTGPVPIRLK